MLNLNQKVATTCVSNHYEGKLAGYYIHSTTAAMQLDRSANMRAHMHAYMYCKKWMVVLTKIIVIFSFTQTQ